VKGPKFIFRLGDTVRIRTGPFQCMSGKVEGINQAKGLLKVAVVTFGRTIFIKLRFLDVETVSFS
jgi:transcriptional antiterminator NusG